jgi:hypothetical protein
VACQLSTCHYIAGNTVVLTGGLPAQYLPVVERYNVQVVVNYNFYSWQKKWLIL